MIRIGTSGWVYGDWRGRFYPKGIPQRRWLEFYAGHFDTVELNATTYRLPKQHQIAAWCRAVPASFVYTVKLSRLITHRKTLPPRVDEFIENYMHRAACFEAGKVAQILVQFPPYLERDDSYLSRFLDKLPSDHRYVVEFRHKSWHGRTVEAMLRERGIALCIHDYPGMKVGNVVTSQFAYVRLHGYEGLYVGSYPRRSLQHWSRRIHSLQEQANDVFVYFNNDTEAAAPHDASVLRQLI
jgi:uncharacterized protein YecE (DUF72 family)